VTSTLLTELLVRHADGLADAVEGPDGVDGLLDELRIDMSDAPLARKFRELPRRQRNLLTKPAQELHDLLR
jgi:hypothetical protein